MLRPRDVDHATSLGLDLSDPLMRIRPGLYHKGGRRILTL
jgi:hypothetical protein